MFWAIDYACLVLVLIAAVLVVRLHNLNGAVMALSSLGTTLALLFVVLGAPDDAHAQIVVGSIALPTLYLIAIGKVRTEIVNEPELGEQGDVRQRGGGRR
jgi:energy-converting hydrogenase B subunit D